MPDDSDGGTTLTSDLAGARGRLETAAGAVDLYRLGWLADQDVGDVSGLPHTVLILLENLLAPRGLPGRLRRRRARARGLARTRW